ncbi:retrotransposon protein, putative, ty1-copia subclass [Tanacetum coccineum]
MTGAKFDIEKFDGTGDFGFYGGSRCGFKIHMDGEAAPERGYRGDDCKRGFWTKLETLYMTRPRPTIVPEEEVCSIRDMPTGSKAKGEEWRKGLNARGKLIAGIATVKGKVKMQVSRCDGGSVQLGDNRECKIRGTLEKEVYTVKLESGKVKVINGSRVILSGIRRDNCVYSLDGHTMTGGTTGARKARAVWQGESRRVWVYILRFKHEAFGRFKEWKQLVENQPGRTVKKLRTDNGLEFCNREFDLLCIESGIARHLTVVETSQQNGVAEAIEKKTHMEMWSGHPSEYGMLRIFGCVAYPHNKQGKIEPRAIKCVLLGYPEGVKGYRLYRLDGESPKIVISRNIVFNESVMYKDTLKDSGAGDKAVKELQVEVELQRFNNHTPEEDQIDQEDGDGEDAGDHETDQTPDLTDYHNMAAYAFAAAEEEDTHEPLTYQEAVACEDSSKWKAAMKEEMDSLRKNKTWELVDHPAGQKLVSCKWLFKIKEGIEGVQKPRYKARLVARGFTQRAGIDYNKVFSLVVRHTSIRVILALTACKDYELEQLDVKTTFLHGNLEEVIYMKQPPGYEQDDMLIACKSKAEIGSTKSLLKKKFDMKELEEGKKILGMEIGRDRSRMILRVLQSEYFSKILNNFRIDNGKSVKMPLGRHFKLSLKDCPVRDCDVERMSKVSYANAVGA